MMECNEGEVLTNVENAGFSERARAVELFNLQDIQNKSKFSVFIEVLQPNGFITRKSNRTKSSKQYIKAFFKFLYSVIQVSMMNSHVHKSCYGAHIFLEWGKGV